MPNLAGIHDIEGMAIAPPDTWILDVVALSDNPVAPAYDARFNWIARLNHGYGSKGTLPAPDQYVEFAARASVYARDSQNCHRWIIGNEPNLPREWPAFGPIFPWSYATCYSMARKAIHMMHGHEHDEVLVAASGPWNSELKYQGNPNGDWIQYFADVIKACGDEIDGFALHAYTHGYDPALADSTARMDAPFQNRYYNFRTYQDYLLAIPEKLRHLPAYITEANGNGPWQATGLMPAMLAEISRWNAQLLPKIQCVVFYRYPHYDDFYIEGCNDVIAEYKAAVGKGYTSPVMGATTMPDNTTFIPAVSNGTQVPAQLPRHIDQRLIDRGTKIIDAQVNPGDTVWHLTDATFFPAGTKPGQAGGRHHVYIEAIDENGLPLSGIPFIFKWSNGSAPIVTNGKTGFDAANQPFSEGRNAFTVTRDHGDTVEGIGMGQDDPGGWNAGEHTSTLLRYQRSVALSETTPPAPAPTGPTATPNTPAGCRVRSGPSQSFPILGSVANGVVMQVTGISISGGAPWYRVISSFGVGWVSSTVVSVANVGGVPEIAPAPVTPTTGTGPTEPVKPTQPTPAGIIDPLTALAFLQVESGNAPFDHGYLTIRFEVHRFKANLHNDDLFNRFFKFAPGNYSKQFYRPTETEGWTNVHGSMLSRHVVLDFARKLNDSAALNSTGMGMAQIMGENHARIGYATPQAMFAAFSHPLYGVNAQVLGFVNYVLSDPALFAALRHRDWMTAVTRYNGEGQQQQYIQQLEAWLDKLANELAST